MRRTLKLDLPDELETEIAAAVAGGEYQSADDAILGAVVEWRAQRLVERIGLEELRRLWRDGLESGPGRFSSMDEIKEEARRRFRMA